MVYSLDGHKIFLLFFTTANSCYTAKKRLYCDKKLVRGLYYTVKPYVVDLFTRNILQRLWDLNCYDIFRNGGKSYNSKDRNSLQLDSCLHYILDWIESLNIAIVTQEPFPSEVFFEHFGTWLVVTNLTGYFIDFNRSFVEALALRGMYLIFITHKCWTIKWGLIPQSVFAISWLLT